MDGAKKKEREERREFNLERNHFQVLRFYRSLTTVTIMVRVHEEQRVESNKIFLKNSLWSIFTFDFDKVVELLVSFI